MSTEVQNTTSSQHDAKLPVDSSLSSSPEIKEIEDRMFLDVKNADTPEKLLRVISFYELEPEECEVGYNPNRQNFLRLVINKIYEMTPNIKLRDVVSGQ